MTLLGLYRILNQKMVGDNMSKTNDNQKTVMVIRQDGTHSLKVITNSKNAKRGSRLRKKTSHALSRAVFGAA